MQTIELLKALDLALTLSTNLTLMAQKVSQMIQAAQAEGRSTLTDAEMLEIKSIRDVARAHAEAVLNS